jgi:hypothetical protein
MPPESQLQTRGSSLLNALSFHPCPGGVCVRKIYASYLCITSHLLRPRHRQLERMLQDAALCPIYLDISTIHDVVAWYCLTVFCQSTPHVGHQV